MVCQLQFDATSLIKYYGVQPANTYAEATGFMLLCCRGVPADYMVDLDVPSKCDQFLIR